MAKDKFIEIVHELSLPRSAEVISPKVGEDLTFILQTGNKEGDWKGDIK